MSDNETVVSVSLASNASGSLLPDSAGGAAPSPYSLNELAGLLRGNTSARVDGGVLIYSDLSIDVPGRQYALLFSAALSGGGGTYRAAAPVLVAPSAERSEEHTSELQSLYTISYAVFCLRSEERRVGKECCTPCRSRWSPYH